MATSGNIDLEREFHNKLADGEISRQDQMKYQFAIRHSGVDYIETIRQLAPGAVVLDYGCYDGAISFLIADVAKHVHGIDISDAAIAQASHTAGERGIRNVTFKAGDAHSTGYPDETFDLIFGSGIIHHLDTRIALSEVRRILKVGGVAVFREPLGENFVFQIYRNRTPEARTPDEHPLLARDYRIARDLFRRVDNRFYGLTTLAAVPFRNTPLGGAVLGGLRAVDRLLFKLPWVKWQGWIAVSKFTR